MTESERDNAGGVVVAGGLIVIFAIVTVVILLGLYAWFLQRRARRATNGLPEKLCPHDQELGSIGKSYPKTAPSFSTSFSNSISIFDEPAVQTADLPASTSSHMDAVNAATLLESCKAASKSLSSSQASLHPAPPSSAEPTQDDFFVDDFDFTNDDVSDDFDFTSSSHADTAPSGTGAAPHSYVARMEASKEEVSILPTTRWADLDPGRDIFAELAANAGIRERVLSIDSVVSDCRTKAQELKFNGTPQPIGMSESGRGALVAYTHDNQTGTRDGNLYFELNKMLRARGVEQRLSMMKVWGGFMFHVMKALAALPAFEGVVYRGYSESTGEYEQGRPIQWGAFSSTTTDIEAARQFMDKAEGVIFKLTVMTGRSINAFSFFPAEGEILLTPSHRFTVTSKPYEMDGYTMIDMVETKGDVFVS